VYFKQWNKFAPSALISTMLIVEKDFDELGRLVFPKVAKWNHYNLTKGKENWEYISQTNFNHYWSSFLKAMGAIERKVYWD
jgi:hypothetical protein